MIFRKNVPLADFNTFGINSTAGEMYIVENKSELFSGEIQNALSKPFFVLGGGSNILLSKDFIPSIIKYNGKGIQFISEDSESRTLQVNAGETWDDVVLFAVDNNLAGIENLSLIPGTAGAAPIQNIGAYGQEVGNAIITVTYYDIPGKCEVTLSNEDCKFGYRDSIFKNQLKGKAIITSITLRLKKIFIPDLRYKQLSEIFLNSNEAPSLKTMRDTIISIRESKLPNPALLGNAGSFFKNPIVSEKQLKFLKSKFETVPSFSSSGLIKIPAAWLIENAGLKAKRIGNVGTYEKQPLVLVNYGGASGEDILKFSELIKSEVFKKLGVSIECEVNIV